MTVKSSSKMHCSTTTTDGSRSISHGRIWANRPETRASAGAAQLDVESDGIALRCRIAVYTNQQLISLVDHRVGVVQQCSEGIGLALGRRVVGDVAPQVAEAGFGVLGRPMARRLG
jgi:hypothetical protein